MKVIYVSLFFLFLFSCVEILVKKFKLNKELSRKFIHISVGILIAFLPFYMSFYSLAILGVIFIPVMFLSKNKNILTSIHHVSRKTYGEIYFPLSIVITALFFPIRYVFIYAILIMAISDGFASVVGQKYARKTYSILKSQKSYVGSFTFFALSLIIGIFVLYSLNIENTAISFLISFICAAILTIVEGALSYGLDNLLIPPLAALLLEIAVKTIK